MRMQPRPQRYRFAKNSHRFNVMGACSYEDAKTLRDLLDALVSQLATARSAASTLLTDSAKLAHALVLHRLYRNLHPDLANLNESEE